MRLSSVSVVTKAFGYFIRGAPHFLCGMKLASNKMPSHTFCWSYHLYYINALVLLYRALNQQTRKSNGTLKLLDVEHTTHRLLWNRQGLKTPPKIYPYHLRMITNVSWLKRPSNSANTWDGRRFSTLTLARMAVTKKHLDFPPENHVHKYLRCLILRRGSC